MQYVNRERQVTRFAITIDIVQHLHFIACKFVFIHDVVLSVVPPERWSQKYGSLWSFVWKHQCYSFSAVKYS